MVSGTPQEIECLSSEVLQVAPKWFFDEYQGLCKKITEEIKDKLSKSDKSWLISKLKEDPTNIELKTQAFYAINNEYLKFDSSGINSEYLSLDPLQKKILFSMVVNEICGLGPLEPLFRDFSIREIICNGPYDIQVEINGNVRRVPSCKFRDEKHLEELIIKLCTSVNKEFSRMSPKVRARLHDQSRVFALHQIAAPSGPSLNIRRHTDDWISPDQLLQWGAASKELLEWLGARINIGMNFVVSGGTSTGKTTLLAALTGFYRNDARILQVENNIELKGCPTKMWGCPMEVVEPKEGSNFGGITMRDLVEATTQQRPDIIVVGEVTGGEAYDLANALNTGHSGASTIHSNSPKEFITRMTSLVTQAEMLKGQAVLDAISSAFDLVVQIKRFPEDGSRKIVEIAEIGTQCVKGENGVIYLPVKTIWKFQQNKMSNIPGAKVTGNWIKVAELSEERRNKHNLDLIQLKSFEELRQLYTEPIE